MRYITGTVKMFTAFNSSNFPLGKLHQGNNSTEANRFMHKDVYYNISLLMGKNCKHSKTSKIRGIIS